MTRQQSRRVALKARKHAVARTINESRAAFLARARELRPAPRVKKRHPGKLAGGMRPFGKPHGQPNWRCRDLAAMPGGQRVPDGCEATFHTTKGLRVVRSGLHD